MNRQLKVLYLSHYYLPEVNAPAVRVSGLTKYWSSHGHKVTVITGFPNHPTGVIPPEYRGRWFKRENIDGVAILRSAIYAAANKGFFKRILNYLSFMVSGTLAAVFCAGKQDIVIATSPQFFVAIAGYVVSRIKRIPFIFEVRDVWPEEIVAVGVMKRNLVIKLLEAIEMFLYHKAKLIVVVATGTIEILTKRGIPREKIALLPNGVDFDRFGNAKSDHSLRDQYNLNGHFLVSYIGTHGMAHNLQTIVKAANILKNKKDIKFIFVGDGAEKNRLLALRDALHLDNITFTPQQQRSRIARYYAASDVCLVPLRRTELFTKNIPSKVYEIMAAAKPILIGTHGESQRLVQRAKAGLSFEPDNCADLAEKIVTLYNNRGLARHLGTNGRRFADTHCRQSVIANQYLSCLEKLC